MRLFIICIISLFSFQAFSQNAMFSLEILTDNKLAIKLSSNAKSMAVPDASVKLKEIILKNLNGELIEFKN